MKRQNHQAPDEAMLTRWMDGELSGDELAQMESWAQEHPGILAERDALQAMQKDIRDSVAADMEPPYADFFNQRILRIIENEPARSRYDTRVSGPHWLGVFWSKWLALPGAAVAMALCFYLGTQVSLVPPAKAPVASTPGRPMIYTPDADIRANVFSSRNTGATVIVLEGLDDLPDDLEIAGNQGPAAESQRHGLMASHTALF